MAPPRRRTRSTGMSPGAMGGRVGSPVTSRPKPSTMSPGERKARTGFAAPKQDLAKQFFKGPVSDDRLRRRLQQDREERDFISQLKVAPGTTNLLQEQAPVFNPMTGQYERTTLAQKRQQLANLYGPTLSEIGSDIGYGIRSIAGGLGQKLMAGELGIMGIAKGLYEQFTNRAAQAKDALVKGVNKLSDIDLEFLKNEDKYPQMSSHPRIQGIKDIQEIGRTETEKADIIRQNIERVSTPITEKDNTVQSAKVFQGPSLTTYPGQGYLTGAGLPAIANQEDNYIKIQNGQAVPISKEEFLEDQRAVEEDFANDPFFADKMTKTSNQMNIAPGYEIVTNYESPEQRMQKLIEQSQQNNNSMFNSGVMTPKQTQNLFNIDLQ